MQEVAANFVDEAISIIHPVIDKCVLVGGACIGLWIDDVFVPPARPTNDIDLVVGCKNRAEYEQIAERFRRLGVYEDSSSEVICRWRHSPTNSIFDIMPIDDGFFGPSNEWHDEAFRTAQEIRFPSGRSMKMATPAYLLATKFVAYEDRGKNDPMASHDAYDIVALLDGCTTLLDSVESAKKATGWLSIRFQKWIASKELHEAIMGYLLPDEVSQSRTPILIDRASQIAALHS